MSNPLPPPIRSGLGNTFKRPITELEVGIAPDGVITISDVLTPELIAAYGVGGSTITGAWIRIDPNSATSQYFFDITGYSAPTNFAFRASGLVEFTSNPGVATVHGSIQDEYLTSTNVHQQNFGDGDSGVDSRLIFNNAYAFFRALVEFGDDIQVDGDINVVGSIFDDNSGVPYTPTQAGEFNQTINAGTTTSSTPIVFNTPFAAAPAVSFGVASAIGSSNGATVRATSRSPSGMTVGVTVPTALAANATFTITWTATEKTQ